jgi:hypothetical protein
MMVSADLPFNDILEFYSRFADGFLPAHVVPLPAPYPITVVAIVAQLSAKRLQQLSGLTSESMTELELAAGAQLKRWAAGLPVRDAALATVPANLTVNQSGSTNPPLNSSPPSGITTLTSTVSISPFDPRGWAVQGPNIIP